MAVTGLLIDAAWKSVFVSTAPPLLGVGNAVALRPVNLKVLDHRKAHTWHMQPLHQLLHAQPIEALPIRDLGPFNARDQRRNALCRGSTARGDAICCGSTACDDANPG
ncbi:MAG: hypothetical protein ACK575_15075 [Cyanobacteriota bacterium]